VLGDAIRAARKQAGFSQEKLAEKADLHPNYIGEVERGEKTISVDSLVRITRALKVKAAQLFTDL
jgi:transcriptional regulator with XRE-family HTH domain